LRTITAHSLPFDQAKGSGVDVAEGVGDGAATGGGGGGTSRLHAASVLTIDPTTSTATTFRDMAKVGNLQ
jgi:hypothetical protein